MGLSAILLAAGSGKRFNSDKLLAELNGKMLVCHIIDAVAASCFDERILVTNNATVKKAATIAGFKTVCNPKAVNGQSTSVIAGLLEAEMENSYAFFVCDQPLISSRTINRMALLHYEQPDKIIVPEAKGRRGSPVIFPNTYRGALLALTGDSGGREIIRGSKKVLVFNDLEEYELIDADTTAEMDRLRGLF